MATYTGKETISNFLGAIGKSGGVAFSNTFEVQFKYQGKSTLEARLNDAGFVQSGSADGAAKTLTLLCEEASLPGILANTGQTTGVRLGEGQRSYAHTRAYQDISFGWICDANLLPLKFLNAWMKTIYQDENGDSANGRYSVTRVNYPDEYQCEVEIRKAERSATSTLGRQNGIYTLYDAWPYSIQSTPLSYGTSQLLKVTASFYYRRWKFNGNSVTE